MQIILLEKVANLGSLGDVVKVKDGYARNFLIPTGQARRATTKSVAEFEARRAELEKASAEKLAAAQAVGEKLGGKTVSVSQKAGVDGRLFGSVTHFDIAEGPKATPPCRWPCTRRGWWTPPSPWWANPSVLLTGQGPFRRARPCKAGAS